jgi:hypothetical protein
VLIYPKYLAGAAAFMTVAILGPIKAQPLDGFEGARWGMSMQQIQSAFGDRLVPFTPPGDDASAKFGFPHYDVVLLRHRIGVAWVVLRGALQHGHRARVVARATIRCRRIVAIEFATCRSGRTGGASGWTTLGNLRRRELIGGIAGG